jgi:hypothetical protein
MHPLDEFAYQQIDKLRQSPPELPTWLNDAKLELKVIKRCCKSCTNPVHYEIRWQATKQDLKIILLSSKHETFYEAVKNLVKISQELGIYKDYTVP